MLFPALASFVKEDWLQSSPALIWPESRALWSVTGSRTATTPTRSTRSCLSLWKKSRTTLSAVGRYIIVALRMEISCSTRLVGMKRMMADKPSEEYGSTEQGDWVWQYPAK